MSFGQMTDLHPNFFSRKLCWPEGHRVKYGTTHLVKCDREALTLPPPDPQRTLPSRQPHSFLTQPAFLGGAGQPHFLNLPLSLEQSYLIEI